MSTMILMLTLTSCLDERSVCRQDEASKIKKEASDLDKLIDKTEKEYNDLRDDLKGKEQEVRKLLEKGKSEQQVRRPPSTSCLLSAMLS